MRRIKVLGAKNSGTNYVRRLIESNFMVPILSGVVPEYNGPTRALFSMLVRTSRTLNLDRAWNEDIANLWFWLTERDNLGWKHQVVDPLWMQRYGRNVGFVTVTKNPYAWLLSLYRRPYNTAVEQPEVTFGQFLRRRLTTQGYRERRKAPYETPIEVWNIKNRRYLALATHHQASILKYEDVLCDVERVLVALAETHGLSFKGEPTNVLCSTKADETRFADYQDYYLNQRWHERLVAEDIAYINERLDADTMGRFGYEMLTPDEVKNDQ